MNDTERDCLVQGNSNRQSVKIQSSPALFLTVFHAATEIDHVLEEELVSGVPDSTSNPWEEIGPWRNPCRLILRWDVSCPLPNDSAKLELKSHGINSQTCLAKEM
ncbi:unnamed protein product [Brassica oleracea]|uniref:Uncharacterized protein n=1 Tax=Brassica cretica TaxID=69181 RepID=A0ABQ7CAS7_BRACR|nr:hypothetical protein DY000_02010545 [Brassica cretica]